MPKRKPDRRAQRTRDRLGSAFLELSLEKPIRDITVQEVLDRSSVGRSTFYVHFRDKDDLLFSQLEGFLEVTSTMLTKRGEKSDRVMPIAEIFDHIGNQNKLYRAIFEAGHLEEFYQLAQGYYARGIEQRLRDTGRFTAVPKRELAARAAALAGSMISLLRWWLDRGEKESPREMDRIFHSMAWAGVQSLPVSKPKS